MTEVAAVILTDEQDRILICRRGAGGSCANLWEFPGGKREPGESLAACAARECREELDVEVELGAVYDTCTFAYPDKEIAFTFFLGHIRAGIPAMRVHSGMCWVSRSELAGFRFCPADADLVRRLACGA